MKYIYFVLMLGFLSCVHQPERHYGFAALSGKVESACVGRLSDIAESISAIPLETNEQCLLRDTLQVQRDGCDLFIISEYKLYHFNQDGKFLNSIILTGNSPNERAVRDYVVDPMNKQLVILAQNNMIHFYSYCGKLQGKKTLPTLLSEQSVLKLSYYDKHIWATTERLISIKPEHKQVYEKWLYRFDVSFNNGQGTKIEEVALNRNYLPGNFTPELAVANNKLYIHSPSLEGDKLLRDTLYLITNNIVEPIVDPTSLAPHPIRMLPLRIHSRFLISCYQTCQTEALNYTFVYDRKKGKSFTLHHGFDDDFYDSGATSNLQALDVHSEAFWYCKSGSTVQNAFPDRKVTDNPVLFIVKLKI